MSNIPVLGIRNHRITLDQFPDTHFQGENGLVAGFLNLLIGNNVVALIRIFSYRCFKEEKRRNFLLNDLAELFLGNIGIGEPHIEDLSLHGPEILQAMQEGPCHIPVVDIVSLEMAFKKYDKTVINRPIGKVVHQKVDPHAGSHPENRRKSKTDGIRVLHQALLDLDLFDRIMGNGMERGLLCAEIVLVP